MSGIQSVSVSASQSFASVATQPQQSLQPFANLDLTEAQRTQIRSIFTSAKQDGTSQADVQSQVNAVLTPAQQQALTGDIKAGGSGHHHHHEADSSSTQTAAAPVASTTSPSTSTGATVLETVTNLQNQAAAAQSTRINTLLNQVLATNGDAAPE